MGAQPTLRGDLILQKSFKVGPAAGLLPFRAVTLDASATLTPAGDDWLPPVKYPTPTAFTDLETIVGVITDPVSETTLGTLDTIAQNKVVNVRVVGVVPLMMDDTMDTAPVLINDYVKASVSGANYGGQGAKATRTNNVIDADAHVIGVAWTGVATNNRFGLVRIQPADF